MQNFTQDVNDIIKKHKTKRLYAITAFVLSLAVVFMVVSSLIRPAISATRLGQAGNDGDTLEDAILLVGNDNSLYTESTDKSVTGITNLANEKYALGIASQFSVFLNGDFTPKDADTEGRIAIGGSLNPSGYIWGSSDGTGYNVGLGHYVSNENSKSLSELGILVEMRH